MKKYGFLDNSNHMKEETSNPIDLWPGTYHVTHRDPYQSIDLIEYYKSCIGQIKLGRGSQTLEGAKIIFQHFISI
jgi:hypothetical protein